MTAKKIPEVLDRTNRYGAAAPAASGGSTPRRASSGSARPERPVPTAGRRGGSHGSAERVLHFLPGGTAGAMHDHERQQALAPRAAGAAGGASGNVRKLRRWLRPALLQGIGRDVDVPA